MQIALQRREVGIAFLAFDRGLVNERDVGPVEAVEQKIHLFGIEHFVGKTRVDFLVRDPSSRDGCIEQGLHGWGIAMRSDHRWWAPVIRKRKEVVVEVQVIPYASGVEWHPRPKNRQQRRLFWLRNQLVGWLRVR